MVAPHLKGFLAFQLLITIFFPGRGQADDRAIKQLTKANILLDQAMEAGEHGNVDELIGLSDNALCILLLEASQALVREALAIPVQEENRVNRLFKEALALLKIAFAHGSDEKLKKEIDREIQFTQLRIKRVKGERLRQNMVVDEQVQLSSGSE